MVASPEIILSAFLKQTRSWPQYALGEQMTPYAETPEFQTGFCQAASLMDEGYFRKHLVNDVTSLAADKYIADISPLWVLGYITGAIFVMQQASLSSDQTCL
jgi:hypothetical protein